MQGRSARAAAVAVCAKVEFQQSLVGLCITAVASSWHDSRIGFHAHRQGSDGGSVVTFGFRQADVAASCA
jgi:hypothetical protein